MWKRYIPKPQLYQFAIHEILNLFIMPYYTVAPNLSDIETFERIITLIPKDWIPFGHSTPRDFKAIEDYLVSLMELSLNAPEISSRLALLFVAINSLDKASIVAKYK